MIQWLVARNHKKKTQKKNTGQICCCSYCFVAGNSYKAIGRPNNQPALQQNINRMNTIVTGYLYNFNPTTSYVNSQAELFNPREDEERDWILDVGLNSTVIIYMNKLLDSDWSRAMQLLCNSVQKSVFSCNYILKANKPIKMQKFLWQRLRHELSVNAPIVTLSLSSFVFSPPSFL